MVCIPFLTGIAIQSLALQSPTPRQDPAASDDGLAIFLANEHAYSERLGQALGQDLKKQWDDYAEDETDKARERAHGEHDDDDGVMSFAVYLDGRYRRRLRPGIAIFAIGFAPLGFGLYIGTSLGEGQNVALAGASIGGAMIVGGAVAWAITGVQLRRFRQRVADFNARSRHARVQWRGLAPLYHPQLRTHGVSLGFAF